MTVPLRRAVLVFSTVLALIATSSGGYSRSADATIPVLMESATCDPTVNAGNAFRATVRFNEPVQSGNTNVRMTPSSLTVVPWGDEGGGVRWFLFNVGEIEQSTRIPTNPVSDDTDLTITFDLFYLGSETVVQTLTCTVAVIGTHNPTPTPTATSNVTPIPSSTPRPTRTPAPTSTIVPGSELESIRAQVGARSGRQSRVSFCLVDPAPAGGTVVSLSSSHPNLLSVPATVTVGMGARCRGLVLAVGDSNRSTVVTLAAELNGFSVSAQTTVRPQRPYISTQVVSRSGGTSKVTVCMRFSAMFGGATVPLTSSDPAMFPLPASAVIGEGGACQSIIVQVGDVQGDTTIIVTATFAEGTRSGQTIVRILDPQRQTAEETAVAPTEAPSLTPVALPTGLPIASPVS